MNTFLHTADSRQTSPELLAAILYVAGGNETLAEQIWRDGPDEDEIVSIIEIVTGNGRVPTTAFHWGNLGPYWAETEDGIEVGNEVEGGEGDDYGRGRVLAIVSSDWVHVAWDNGTRSDAPTDGLSVID